MGAENPEDAAEHMASRGSRPRLIALLKGTIPGRGHYRKEHLEPFKCVCSHLLATLALCLSPGAVTYCSNAFSQLTSGADEKVRELRHSTSSQSKHNYTQTTTQPYFENETMPLAVRGIPSLARVCGGGVWCKMGK